ncbi:MAG: hypothetical protein EOP06_03875 [Proteobacteria bacterium]|nr:MAG: hypothetical protein EOP06_03875 [Pseudomonadota bacterium]
MTVSRDRLELVYQSRTNFDVPTKLQKVRSDEAKQKAERWIMGFVRQYRRYYFMTPEAPDTLAKKALAWIHAHSSEAGKTRAELLLADFKGYAENRKSTFRKFVAVNDMSATKITKSKSSDELFFVKMPGTYIINTPEGMALFPDAILSLAVKVVGVNGVDSGYGEINITGLEVEDGGVEYVIDHSKPNEKTVDRLFFPK